MPLDGATELRKLLQGLKREAPAALGAGLYEEGVEIIAESDEDVPYEFGHLRRSHFVELPHEGTNGPELELGYGAGYGLFVHEVPASHPKGGKDHFLRDAFVKRMSGFEARLARRTQAHLVAGTGVGQLGVPSKRPDPMAAVLAEQADRERARRRGRARSIRDQNAARARGR